MNYATCPGDCESLVRVGEDGYVPFCCQLCWKTVWGAMSQQMEGLVEGEFEDFGHSEQCQVRQLTRRASLAVQEDPDKDV